MKPIIEINKISKKYSLIQQQLPYHSLRDEISDLFFHPLALVKRLKEKREELWALRDIDLKIMPGETIGIIGLNGAGKSTLLKILSRITSPSSGTIRLKGKVASLLEVGAGFSPELTGRENIFLNGAILGMNRNEIKRKFKEIVAFAEIEKFLDTPVKHYSTGMYMKLAFSVAAHLDSDILLVDEVLAVGDIAFQKKCLKRMEEVTKKRGRTIIFVSHNLDAVSRLCKKTVLLNAGYLKDFGPTDKVIAEYIKINSKVVTVPLSDRVDRRGKGKIKFQDIHFDNKKGHIVGYNEDIEIEIKIVSNYSYSVNRRLVLTISTISQIGLISCDTNILGKTYPIFQGENSLACHISALPLSPGEYEINLAIFDGSDPEDWVVSAARFTVIGGKYGYRENISKNFPIAANFSWAVKSVK